MSDPGRRIADLSPQPRARPRSRLSHKGAVADERIMPRREASDRCPLSFAQQRLWFLQQLEPDNTSYNMHRAIRMSGTLDVGSLRQALEAIVSRHEVLRTSFTMVDGQPMQVITPTPSVPLPVEDLSELPEPEREAAALRRAHEETQRPFDLDQGPPLRANLLRLGGREHVLLIGIHHIISDVWSMDVFWWELGVLYDAFAAGEPSPLAELPIQYADFAVWQRQRLQGEMLDKQLSYWEQRLSASSPTLELPTDRPRPSVQTFRGARQSLALPKPLTEALQELSHREGVTLSMTLLAAFQTLLYRYTGQDDVVVGSPIANHSRETEGLIGFFANTLVLRTDLSGDPTFRELLGRVREVCLGAYDHQDIPFEKLVEELRPERDTSRSPLFQVLFALQNMSTLELSGLTTEWLEIDNSTAKFDLTLFMVDELDGLRGTFEYNTDLFEAATITRMLGHFQTLLEGVVANPEQRLSELPLLSATERQQLLVEWNETTDYPQDECLHRLFEAQVERTPDAVAVAFEDEQLTYRELNRRTNQLAHHLRELGVGPEVLVGICVERSLEMVVGLLGILKAGGAYVPLDPAYPKERLSFMLEDAWVSVLLTQRRLLERLPEHGTQVVCLDTDWEEIAQESEENPLSEATAENLAYVIYTSGSTGKPKGVLVSHNNVVRLFAATQPRFQFKEEDVWTLFHSYAFDFSVWELWGALLYGGRLVVVPYWVSRSPEAFYDFLCTEQVTVLNQTPSAFRQLLQVEEQSADAAQKLSLRLLIFGGEALELQSLRPWLDRHGEQHPQLVNMYGITETTVHATYRRLEMADLSKASGSVIGGPIADLQVYILDTHLQPTPLGVAGEMYVGGAGLARGYLGRPELTAERFIPNPFGEELGVGARLYKTGDLARYLPDGDIEYLGRLDHQVKVRGFRIELGEVEAVLSGYTAVREAVVVCEDGAGDKRLIAYLVGAREPAPSVSELRSYLKEKLPEYMVPSAFVVLEALPLTPNGKVDRRVLSAPEDLHAQLEGVFVSPRDTLEERLAEIWAEVLGVAQVGVHDDLFEPGVHDNFFELGGHSLLATQVISRLRRALQVELPLRDLFEAPTVALLAQRVQAVHTADEPTSSSRMAKMSPDQLNEGRL